MDSGDDYRPDLQEQIDALRGRVDDNHWEIDKLARAGKLDRDDIDALVKAGSLDHDDIAKLMASGMLDRDDIDRLLVQIEIDRKLIAELQADDVIARDHVADLEQALRSSRKIGTAIGIIVAQRNVTEAQAFQVLAQASKSSNRKLRDIAEDVVRTGRPPDAH